MTTQATILAAAIWEARRLLVAWADTGDNDPSALCAELFDVLDTPEVRQALEQLSDDGGELTTA